jgi:hypothetical protein
MLRRSHPSGRKPLMASHLDLNRILRFNDPFVTWVIRVITALYLCLTVSPILKLLNKMPWVQWMRQFVPNAHVAADALQVLAMALLIGPCWIVRPNISATEDDDKREIALVASDQFQTFWIWLISMWLFFYLSLLLRESAHDPNIIQIWDAAIDLLNNAQGIFLFLCYWVLTTITVREKPRATSRVVVRSRAFPYALLIVWLLLFFVADLAAGPSAERRMVFRLLSGLWVGVSMGLLVGCLESEYLNVVHARYPNSRRLVISLLYLYAVLQVAYVGYGFATGSRELTLMGNFASILSLPLKLLFIGLCYWLLREGRLEFYMQITRKAIQTADNEWHEFKEAR